VAELLGGVRGRSEDQFSQRLLVLAVRVEQRARAVLTDRPCRVDATHTCDGVVPGHDGAVRSEKKRRVRHRLQQSRRTDRRLRPGALLPGRLALAGGATVSTDRPHYGVPVRSGRVRPVRLRLAGTLAVGPNAEQTPDRSDQPLCSHRRIEV
jgi:hypothetical protein